MRLLPAMIFGCLLFAGGSTSSGATPENEIRVVLQKQVEAWNRQNLKEFVASYAPHCTLVGSTIAETTREQVLKHYQQKYPSADAMGQLAFSELVVHRLDSSVATATGHWRLQRNTAAGGSVGGLFSLVFEVIDGQWQIVLDHTS